MVEQVDSISTQSTMHVSGSTVGWYELLRRFLGLIRFSHTVFALPFAATATVWSLAVPRNSSSLTASAIMVRCMGILLCMVAARSAAMAFNRLVDAEIDARNPRTAQRHLPAGLLSRRQVWMFFWATCVLFGAACCLFLPNWLPLVGALPVLVWICGYSLAKRFTAAAHVWLGIALALSPLCAWIAMRGEELLINPVEILPAVGLAMAIALWVAGFDIIYACQDADFDRAAKLHSLPSRLGVAGALRVAAAFHGAMLVVLCSLPILFPQLSLGWLTTGTLVIIAALTIQQHLLVHPNDLSRVNVSFFNINAVISFCFSLAASIDAVWR